MTDEELIRGLTDLIDALRRRNATEEETEDAVRDYYAHPEETA